MLKYIFIAILFAGCAIDHPLPLPQADAGTGACLIDDPCWCLIIRPDGGTPFGYCRRTREECESIEGPGRDAECIWQP